MGRATLVVLRGLGVKPESWVGVGVTTGGYILAGAAIWFWSRRQGWGLRHIAAVAATPLIVRALLAFTYDSLVGQVAATARHALIATMMVVVAMAVRPRSAVPEHVDAADPAPDPWDPVRPSP